MLVGVGSKDRTRQQDLDVQPTCCRHTGASQKEEQSPVARACAMTFRGGAPENEQGPSGHEAGWVFWQRQQHEQSMEVGWRWDPKWPLLGP